MPNYENLKLFRILGSEAKQIDTSGKRGSKSQQNAYLVPFRMLSVSGFKFPFLNPTRIREAIKLQTVSYSGGNAIQIFPVLVSKSSKEASVFSFFLPDNELIDLEKILGSTSSPAFPAPLSLASSVNGNGITVWTDEKNICSVIWRSGVPELYRWCARKESALDSEINWLKKYCESKEIEENNDIFIFDAESDSENLLSIIRQSFISFPWLKEINLSRGAINSVMILERFVRFASKAAVWLTVLGTIFAAGVWMNHSMISGALADTRRRSEQLYREVFDKEGRIADPVSQARERINALKGSGATGKTFDGVLSDLGIPWQIQSIDVTIDSMRYNSEGAVLSGTAENMATIQSLRNSLADADMGGTVQLGEVNQIPGGGFRFTLVIRWE